MKEATENIPAQKGVLDPTHALTPAQSAIVQACLAICLQASPQKTRVILIEGDAGCGKSLVLNALFSQLQQAARDMKMTSVLRGTRNYLLVNHPEMLKLYKDSARQNRWLRQKDFERPTTFINASHKQQKQANILLVDEAHLLLTRPDPYNHFRQDNHLSELLGLAQVLILVYDPQQVIKFKSFWDADRLDTLLHGYDVTRLVLSQQFRMQANDDVLAWVKGITHKQILPLPAKQDYDFRIFTDAATMYQELLRKNARHGMGRILATYDYPYRLDGKDYFITEGRFSLRWDRAKPAETLSWAQRDDTVEEVGSVYTIQGFDLNYAAVIIGPSFQYDPVHDCMTIDVGRYEDKAAFQGMKDVGDRQQAKEAVMLHALNVLLTRGRLGLYVYISDPALRERILSGAHH